MPPTKKTALPEKPISSAKRRARELRQQKRMNLLSLQKLPAEKFERVFKKISAGELRLVGLREKPDQRPAFVGAVEED